MALVNIKDMLEKARKEKYCVAAFDASTVEMAARIVEAAEELKSPVILMGLTPDLQVCGGDMLDYWVMSLSAMAKKASVPVCLHLDHAKDMDFLKKCVDHGFTSVMYDASTESLEENIRLSKEAADYAHKKDVTVEAELGHVGDGIISGKKNDSGEYDNPDDFLTNPEELKRFVDETGVDCLAVAVGTSHGVYVHTPKLHFDRLKELNEISKVPMVMHGGSGTPEDQLKEAIANGICKLNVYSEIVSAYYTSLRDYLNNADNMSIWVSNADKEPMEALKEAVKAKIELCGSVNKA